MVVQYTTHRVEPGITVAEFTGQLTLGNRLLEVEHDIKEKILKDCTKLVLDLTRLSFIDSAGIGMLALCVGTLQRAGGQVGTLPSPPRAGRDTWCSGRGKGEPLCVPSLPRRPQPRKC